ncbi:MAG: helix-hairpin-helix domain-containing protein [Pseudomonadota bacterium]
MKTRLYSIAALLFAGVLSVAQAASINININTATASQLAEALNGIGDAKAEAIVAFRETHGDFLSVDDLTLVDGIGEALLERNRALLILE